MIVLGNRCINLCPQWSILRQMQKVSQEIFSEELDWIPVSSSSRSLGVENQTSAKSCSICENYLFKEIHNFQYLFERPPRAQRILYNTIRARLWSYAGGSWGASARFEYLERCSLDQLSVTHTDRALCQSVTLPSLLATGSTGVQADIPGLCQSIAYMTTC